MQMIGTYIQEMLWASWEVLQEASFYILIGLLFGGLLKMFLTPATVASHLGRGRILPVLKAAFFGIPIPLCSCGVLPAAAAIKKQGANSGATMAFLISTPESGVDSISISWALLDPIMTVVRPVAAFVSAVVAGVIENYRSIPGNGNSETTEPTPPTENCCESPACPPGKEPGSERIRDKLVQTIRYTGTELWGDLAFPFFVGTLLAGMIYVFIPDAFIEEYLGGGLQSMLLMLLLGVPLYICATASTPIAAALILKGVSPGAALVFLLVGPATNITSVAVLFKLLGKRATGVYLASIVVVSVLFGLGLDRLYALAGISAEAAMGEAAELVPAWLKNVSVVVLVLLSIPLAWKYLHGKFGQQRSSCSCTGSAPAAVLSCCGEEAGQDLVCGYCSVQVADNQAKGNQTNKSI